MMNKPGFVALQQAAKWYAEIQETPSGESYPVAFQRWLDENPENPQAWQYVLKISDRFMPLRENETRKTAALTALTRTPHNAGRRQALKVAAGLSLGSLLGWASWRHTPLRDQMLAWRADYHSPQGAITPFTLSDGSRIWLDTDSALNARYSPTQRALRLLNGRVMIETAADPARSLTVDTAQGKMRALGTRFSVQIRNDTTVMQVFRGAVAVLPADISDTLVVKAGQAVTFRQGETASVVAIHEPEPAWTRGLLQAENLPLGVFIKQLAAYRKGYLGCDPAVETLHVTGTFPLYNTDMALEMLTSVLPVRIHRRFSWWLTVAPAVDSANAKNKFA